MLIGNLKRPTGLLIVIALLLILAPGCGLSMDYGKEAKEEKKVLGYTKAFNPRVKEIEVILKEDGFNPGAADGMVDGGFRKAVKGFQNKYGLKESGYIDTGTYEKLNSVNAERMRKKQAAKAQPPKAAAKTPVTKTSK